MDLNVRGGGGSGGTSGSGFRLGRCSSPATFSTLQPCLVPALSLAPLLYSILPCSFSTLQPCLVPTLALAPLLNSILTCPCCLASFTHLSTLRAQFHVLPYSLLSACPCLALALHSTLADLHGPPQGDNIFLSSTSPFSWPT